METPQEKAKRLGVPLRHTPPMFKEPEPNIYTHKRDWLKEMNDRLGKPVSVCETCGKELTRQQERACGNQLCPFGYLSY